VLHRSRLVAGTLCAAAALVSCGGKDSDAGQIQDVTKEFASAIKDKDYGKACDQLSAKARAQISSEGAAVGGKECVDTLTRVMTLADPKEVKSITDIHLTDVKVTGSTATGKSGGDTTRFVKEGGVWKIDADSGVGGG
jgi:hypothetical protein